MLFDAAFDSPFTAATPPTVDFVVTRDGSTEEDAVYDVDPLVDTANPFGDYCVIKIDDRGGTKFEQYPRGTRIDVEIRSDLGIIDRFTGYVVERRELDQQGADALEVEAYSFDQFLRRNTVTNDQSGGTIAEVLEDIIKTDTPVTFNASKVDVGDDQELRRTYQGEPVETVLRDFAFKSRNEEFGVDDDLEFFFRPREGTHIDRGVDNTQWFNYDIPELGKEAINEVEVWFDDGEESVIVDDGTDKLDLQDSLGLPDPGTQRQELQRPLVTDIADAEDIGRKYLQFRNSTLSGTVTTFGLFDAEPGDTINITIDARGIDTEFLIAAVEYRWAVDETLLTVVEKRGDVDDILADLSESVQRQEMEGANRDAPKNRITTTNVTAIVTPSADVDGNTPDAIRYVNDGRRAARDGWRGAGLPDIDTLAVGDDGAGLSRSNTDLNNQTNSASASESLPDSTTVEYSASLTQTGVEEVGLFTASGDLIARGVFDSPVDIDGTVTVSLSVANDPDVSRGVLTNDGQTAVRDTLADNSPNLPTDYAYGSDGSAVAESDTALGNELVSVSLEEILIQDADADSEWNDITSTDDTTATGVSGGEYGTTQVAFTEEGENLTGDFENSSRTADSKYSNDQSGALQFDDQFFELTFTPTVDIPQSDLGLYIRAEDLDDNGTPQVTFSLNGDSWTAVSDGANIDFDWDNWATFETGTDETYDGGDLSAGTTYTFRADADTDTSTSAGFVFDAVAVLNEQFSFTFDNYTTGTGERISGPELFPEQVITSFATATTRREVTEARFDLTANDVSDNFFVELANDGSTFTRINNSQTGSVTFASPERDVDTNISLGRFGSDTSRTPTTGFNGQAVDVWNLFADPAAVTVDDIGKTVARAVVAPDTITGDTVREAGLKNGSTLLTRHELAEFDVLAGQRLASDETTLFTGPE